MLNANDFHFINGMLAGFIAALCGVAVGVTVLMLLLLAGIV